jgi:hypothetical protein
MKEEERKKLRAYFYSLTSLNKVFEEAEHANIQGDPVDTLEREISTRFEDFPNLVPEFKKSDYLAQISGRDQYYRVAGVRSYLSTALARLKVEAESDDGIPVTEQRDFSFINDSDLRAVIERDYSEIQRAFIAKCWKSVIILSGGAIEAILTDVLLANESTAINASLAPREPDIRKWALADLIKVSVELNCVQQGVDKLSHSVREYRNLVHPGREIREGLTFDEEEAKIALEVFHMIHRDLSP